MLFTEKQARALAEKMLRMSRSEDVSVTVSRSEVSHLRFAANAFGTNGAVDTFSAFITVWNGRRAGSASASDPGDEALRAAVDQAEQLSRIAPEDKEYMPTLGPQTYRPEKGFVAGTANLSVDARASTINEVITACEKAGVIGAGFHQTTASTSGTLTRNGNFHFSRSTHAGLSVTARTPNGSGSGYFIRNHFDIAKLDTKRITQEAIRKALESQNPQPLEPGVYEVILEPQAVGDLIARLAFSFDARSAMEGRSVFSAPEGKTLLGAKMFDSNIQLRSDPWHPEVPSGTSYGGLPAQAMHLIRNGAIENLVFSRYWAKEKSVSPTPGPTNVILESTGPQASLEEMIRSMKRGVLVSRFWYIRMVDPRTLLHTGLTRDGLWLVENGKIVYPVRNFRFNQSVTALLAPGNILQAGKPERVSTSEGESGGAGLMPALHLKEFHFTSVSEAV